MPIGDFEREVLRVAHEADVAALRKAGFAVEGVGRIHDDFRRARVSRDGRQTKLEWALDVADVRLEQPLDLVAAKQEWFEAVQGARQLVSRLPARDLGCLYLDASGRPVCPDPDAPGFDALRRHRGTLRGPLARMIE